MSFENYLDMDMNDPEFSRVVYLKNFKERQNVSKSRLDGDAGCVFLDPGDIYQYKYDNKLGARYVACMDMSYDLVLSVFDVNGGTILVHRFYEFGKESRDAMDSHLRKMPLSNVEARIAGMQNNQYFKALIASFLYLKERKLPLYEIDLFGGDTRNVAFDIKTGLSLDVLALSRPYKPGELATKKTVEQFERELKERARSPYAVSGWRAQK